MNNQLEASDRAKLSVEKVVDIKSFQSINESNLMTLPFISLKRAKVYDIDRTWIRNGKEVNLKVVGSSKRGCPRIQDLDVLMALFKIMTNSIDNKLEVLNTENNIQVTNIPKVINFTYRGLAKQMGLKGFGKTTQKRLDDSIRCLTECTLYSTLSMRDQELGDYVVDFDGIESSRILKNYKSYKMDNFRLMGKKLLSPDKIEDYQSIEIDNFFFRNMCNNYFKVYDYEKYKSLTRSISKKLLLILAQWSHGYEKYISNQTLYDYIGIDVVDNDSAYYYNREIKKSLDELVKIKVINDYKIEPLGVTFVFNTSRRLKAKGLDKYKDDAEIVCRLREIGIDYSDINKYCQLDTTPYISALLRYVDVKEELGQIKDIKLFTLKGLRLDSYDVREYMV